MAPSHTTGDRQPVAVLRASPALGFKMRLSGVLDHVRVLAVSREPVEQIGDQVDSNRQRHVREISYAPGSKLESYRLAKSAHRLQLGTEGKYRGLKDGAPYCGC